MAANLYVSSIGNFKTSVACFRYFSVVKRDNIDGHPVHFSEFILIVGNRFISDFIRISPSRKLIWCVHRISRTSIIFNSPVVRNLRSSVLVWTCFDKLRLSPDDNELNMEEACRIIPRNFDWAFQKQVRITFLLPLKLVWLCTYFM